MFGDDIIVAPIVNAVNSDSNLASKKVWVPPGEWIDYNTGKQYTGCSTCYLDQTLFDVSEIPMLIRAGAIITRRM